MSAIVQSCVWFLRLRFARIIKCHGSFHAVNDLDHFETYCVLGSHQFVVMIMNTAYPWSDVCLFYWVATVATTVGTVVAYLLVPMRALGPDSWKIAAALMGRHIGGGNLFATL